MELSSSKLKGDRIIQSKLAESYDTKFWCQANKEEWMLHQSVETFNSCNLFQLYIYFLNLINHATTVEKHHFFSSFYENNHPFG